MSVNRIVYLLLSALILFISPLHSQITYHHKLERPSSADHQRLYHSCLAANGEVAFVFDNRGTSGLTSERGISVINAAGGQRWSKACNFDPRAVDQMNDGSFVVGGELSGDLVLARFNTAGTMTWLRKFGATGVTERMKDVKVAANGNIWIMAYSGSSPNFTTVIAEFDTGGNLLWTQQLANNNGLNQYSRLKRQGANMVASVNNGRLLCFASGGTLQWARSLPLTQLSNIDALLFDVAPDQSIWVLYADNAGNGACLYNKLVVARFDANLNFLWSRKFINYNCGSGTRSYEPADLLVLNDNSAFLSFYHRVGSATVTRTYQYSRIDAAGNNWLAQENSGPYTLTNLANYAHRWHQHSDGAMSFLSGTYFGSALSPPPQDTTGYLRKYPPLDVANSCPSLIQTAVAATEPNVSITPAVITPSFTIPTWTFATLAPYTLAADPSIVNGCINCYSAAPVQNILGPDFTTCQSSQTLAPNNPLAVSWLWSTGSTQPSITVTSSGSYAVTVTLGGACPGTLTDTIAVTFSPMSPAVNITPSGPTSFCAGGSVTLDAGTNTGWISYAWSNGATTQSIIVSSSGSYTVTVTDANGCTSTDTEVVTVFPLPTGGIFPGFGTFCQGNAVTLDAGAGWTSYLWSTGATTQTITVTTSGSYQCTVTNNNGCNGVFSAFINFVPSPTVTITAPNSGYICPNQSNITLTASGPPGTFAWSNGATTSSITVSTPGTYTVTLTDANGCIDTDSYSVSNFIFCQPPSQQAPTNITNNSAQLNWAAVPCANKYRIYYRPNGALAWTQIVLNAPATSYTLTGLAPNTMYQWRMRTNCSGGGISLYSPTLTFNTPLKTLDPAASPAPASALVAFPNPADGHFSISCITDEALPYTLTARDAEGRTLFVQEGMTGAGESLIGLNLTSHADGLYLIEVNLNGEPHHLRVVKLAE